MRETRNTIILTVLIITGFAAVGALLYQNRNPSPQVHDSTHTRKLATTLESHGLWAQAVKKYSKLIDVGDLSPAERAKINFHVAEIYLDRLSDPESALPYLLATKLIEGDSELGSKADKRIVEAFEKSGRSIDAANYLASAASVQPQKPGVKAGEVVVAKVGDKTITLRELDDEIQQLPPQLQEQFKNPEKKIEFLQNIIARNLLLLAAQRAGIDREPEIEKAAQSAREAAIIAKYHQKEIAPKIRITEADVRAYYDSHKDEFAIKDKKGKKKQLSYMEAKDRARAMLEAQMQREKLNETLNRLQQSESIEIYSDRITSK